MVSNVDRDRLIWGGEGIIIKAQTTHRAEQRRYGANAQMLFSLVWWGPIMNNARTRNVDWCRHL